MNNAKPKGLGRGLEAIFDVGNTSLTEKPAKQLSNMTELEIALICANPKQPRSVFDEVALGELAESIRTLGVIQPITVRSEGNKYLIISGERRWRASQLAGLTSIPAYIREADNQLLHEMALVENIQRQDLNPIDIALSLQRLVDECNLTQDALAGRVGKKRSTIANYMRLLKLATEVQLALRDEYITMGHAKAIGSLDNEELQLKLLKKVIKKSLSVRQTEVSAAALAKGKQDDKEVLEEEFPESYTKLVEELERFFSQEISIKKSKNGGGVISIEFKDDKDIETFVEKFKKH